MTLFEPGQIFLVTGASSGIGRACALAISRAGGTVICNGRNRDQLERTCSHAAFPERIFAEPLDLAENLPSLGAWLMNLTRKYGKLTGLVNSAGITWNSPLAFYDLSTVNKIFNICCHAPLVLSGAFCSRRVNKGPGSAIVNIAAAAAVEPNPGQGAYAAAKAALVTGSRCLAKESAKNGIRVNCVSPGLVEGAMLEQTCASLGGAFLEREEKAYPLGIGKPEYIADMVIFLLSGRAAWITGQNFVVAGGRL